MRTRTINTLLLFSATLTLILLSTALAIALNKPAKAEPNTVTNFICESRGEWSNEHYNVRDAKYRESGEWLITYRDSGKVSLYIQRRGEDCRTEVFPTPAKG